MSLGARAGGTRDYGTEGLKTCAGSGLAGDEDQAHLRDFNAVKAGFDAGIGGGDRTGLLERGGAKHEDAEGAFGIKDRAAKEADAAGILVFPID